MNYSAFLSGIMWTKTQWTLDQQNRRLPMKFSYMALRAIGRDYWLHLERMNQTQLGTDIINGFLNTREWNCHLDRPSSPKGATMVNNLQSAVHKLARYYAALGLFNICDVDFFGTTLLGQMISPISLVIAEIYATFCDIKPRFGPVPTSKLMHMALPSLFVMWDDAIIKEYHVPSYPSDKPQYLSFLVLMQENARHIRATDPTGLNLNWGNLVAQINAQCGYNGLSMARLLDIANHAVGYPARGAPNIRCVECCERANITLSNLESHIKQVTGFQDVPLGRFKC